MKKTFLLFTFCLVLPLFSQYTDSSNVKLNISMDAKVEPASVPLNRTMTLIISVAWTGDLGVIEIGDVEMPELANFIIVGSGSSNRIEAGATGQRSVKEIRYVLEPQTLGMAYIEPVIFTYIDKVANEERQLMSQRFSVEILSPVAEPGQMTLPWPVIIFAVLLFAAAFLFFMRNRRANNITDQDIDTPIEELFLEKLKTEVDLKSDGREAYTGLAKLFRGYVADKYDLPARETPTENLIELLKDTDLDAAQHEKFCRLLSSADKVKFSGQSADISELTDAYTSFEILLERRLADNLAEISKPSEKKNRFSKGK
ncbi:hypothetical protein KAR48_11725 [bacterium]|nr:hypothetical protein [bacterium]